MTWRSPDTYQPAGLRRGTATSKSTPAGTTSRDFAGSVIRNPQYYFRPGLTWPPRTNSAFGPRALPAGGAFGHKGPAIIPYGDAAASLVYLKTRLAQALLDAMVSAGDETRAVESRSYEVGLIQNLPWPSTAVADPALAAVGRELIDAAAERDRPDETARVFAGLSIGDVSSVRAVAEMALRVHEDRSCEMLDRSHTAEQSLYAALKLDDDGLAYLDDEIGAHPASYERAALPDEDLAARYLAEPIDRVIAESLERFGGSRAIATLNHVADRRLELLARIFQRHPSVVVQFRRERGILPPEEPASTAAALVSWLVGGAFGRWDVRGPLPTVAFDPFAPVPICPPAMLVGDDGFPTTVVPEGYPLPVPPDGILLDAPGHALDLPSAIEVAARRSLTHGEDLLADAVSVLGKRTLRGYVAKAFFKDHLGRYSKSRRQAPVYWQLTIPSGGWSAWLYAPRFSREMLYALVTLVDHRLAGASDRIRALQDDTASSARQRAKGLDEERTLAAELQDLREDVARLAGLGWQPDLDDGFVLCAAPLAKWFPRNTWRQLSEQLAAIREGAYQWATVHAYREAL